ALVEREVAEGAADVLTGRRLVVHERVGDVVLEGDLGRTSRRLPEPLATDVVGDRDQPVLRLLRPVALLDERAVGVEEGCLRDVLGVSGVAQHREGVAIHIPDVPRVHPLEGPVGPRPLRQQGRHALLDTSSGGILRQCFYGNFGSGGAWSGKGGAWGSWTGSAAGTGSDRPDDPLGRAIRDGRGGL